MKCILITTRGEKEIEPLLKRRPSALLQIVDKPMIIHIIESLLREGVDEIFIVLPEDLTQIEEVVGDGRRWGIHLEYYRVKGDSTTIGELLPLIDKIKDDIFFLAKSDLLPFFKVGKLLELYETHSSPLFIHSSLHGWTGWAVLPIKDVKNLSENTLWSELILESREVWTHEHFSVKTYQDIQKSNEKALTAKGREEYLFPAYSRIERPGIWVSHGASISSSVEIRPPVFIGEHCQIRSHVILGPNVVIESGSYIDQHTIVENSLICSQSYVGEGLEIRSCIIDRNLLINIQLNTHLFIDDDVLIAEIPQKSFLRHFWTDLKKLFK